MTYKNFFKIVLSILFLFSFSSINAAPTKYLTADQAFVPFFDQNEDNISFAFLLAPNYYLYQERFEITGTNAEISEITFNPNGHEHDDEYMGLSHVFFNEDNLRLEAKILSTQDNPQITIRYQGCTEGMCYPPIYKTFNLQPINQQNTNQNTNTSSSSLETTNIELNQPIIQDNSSINNQNNDIKNENSNTDATTVYSSIKNKGFLIGLGSFFIFGILLSLTPCVFPMYPILSSIVLGNQKRTFASSLWYSFMYVQGMALTYMVIGIIIASFGAKFHATIQQPLFLSIISIFFIIIALSMFGLFNFALPQSLTNKLENISNNAKGGSIIGVMSMGCISAIVASPCTTAPLTGALMFIIQDGDLTKGASFLYALGLGMGIPLLIIAILGKKFLPKGGNWMEYIKVICGYLMLCVPILLLHSILPDYLSVILYFVIFASLLIYLAFILLNKIVNQSKKKAFIIIGNVVAILIVTTVCIIYLQDDIFSNSTTHKLKFIEVTQVSEIEKEIKLNDYVLVDIRADWCKACKEYEAVTFVDNSVKQELKSYKLLSLDITEYNDELNQVLQHYQATGAPTILVFQKGKLVSKIDGFTEPNIFIKYISTSKN